MSHQDWPICWPSDAPAPREFPEIVMNSKPRPERHKPSFQAAGLVPRPHNAPTGDCAALVHGGDESPTPPQCSARVSSPAQTLDPCSTRSAQVSDLAEMPDRRSPLPRVRRGPPTTVRRRSPTSPKPPTERSPLPEHQSPLPSTKGAPHRSPGQRPGNRPQNEPHSPEGARHNRNMGFGVGPQIAPTWLPKRDGAPNPRALPWAKIDSPCGAEASAFLGSLGL